MVAAPAGVPLLWRDPWAEVAAGGVSYAAAEGHPGASWRLVEALVPREALDGLAATGIPAAGSLALEALRIAAWRPRQSSVITSYSGIGSPVEK